MAKRTPRKPSGLQLDIKQQEFQISFDPMAFDNFVKSQGIWVSHYKAIADPRGMISRGDNRYTIHFHNSSDGFIYKHAGDLQILFSFGGYNAKITEVGELPDSSAVATIPRFYPDTNELVMLHVWDKFYLKDVEVVSTNIQFVETSKDGVDRLQFPAVTVEYIVDARGVWYQQERDYIVTENGDIQWISNNRPHYNAELGRGTIYAVRYQYIPYFIVFRFLHEIRVAQITDHKTNTRWLEKMPYHVQLIRENVIRDYTQPPTPESIVRTQVKYPDNEIIGIPDLLKPIKT